jgi:cytochrome P450
VTIAHVARVQTFPLGASVTIAALETEPYAVLARLREAEPVSWLPALNAWLVTRRDLGLQVMRDAATFTVDDPRFSTAQVVGTSMLSTDGPEHSRHRDPFARAFRLDAVRERFEAAVEEDAVRLVEELRPQGRGELRRGLAGPLAVHAMMLALGLEGADPQVVLGWYDAIVAAVTEITAGGRPSDAARRSFTELREAVRAAAAGPSGSLVTVATRAHRLSADEVASNAAVLLFGGIETTEGMIANAILHVLQHPDALAAVRDDPQLVAGAVEESLRLEPAAAVVDRYATQDVELAGIGIPRGDLVRVSLTAANRDPAVFPDPDRYDVRRGNAQLHAAFAQGPHVCLGMHLARIEGRAAVLAVLDLLPRLRLDPDRPSVVGGLVFRKPHSLNVVWA